MTVANLVQDLGYQRGRPAIRTLTLVLFTACFAFAAYAIAVGPRNDLPYAFHVDEWTHLAYAEALVQNDRVPHIEPLYGQDIVGYRPELGFRVVLAELYLVTGTNWEAMSRIVAGAGFVLFVVTMLYLGRVLGTGNLIGLIALGTPTTLRFLGPALVVPVALALSFLTALPIILLQPSLRDSWRGPILVSLLLLATIVVHPPTGLVAAPIVAGVAAYLASRRGRPMEVSLWISAVLGLLIPLVWFLLLSGALRSELLSEAALTVEDGQGLVKDFISNVGIVRLSLFAIAVFAIFYWKILDELSLPYLALMGAYGLLVAFVGLHTLGAVSGANLYDRSWLYLDVTVSVTAGLGLTIIGERLHKNNGYLSKLLGKSRLILLCLLAGLIVSTAWYSQAREPWYRLATQESLEDFRWIGEHLNGTVGLTLINPVVAVTYPAIAGRPVYASASAPKPSSEDRIRRAFQMLDVPKPDVVAMREENIGIVYGPTWKASEGVVEVRPGIFVVLGNGDLWRNDVAISSLARAK